MTPSARVGDIHIRYTAAEPTDHLMSMGVSRMRLCSQGDKSPSEESGSGRTHGRSAELGVHVGLGDAADPAFE